MEENRISSISKVDTDTKIGEFWDTHDFTEFDTDAIDVPLEAVCAVPIEVDLFNALEQQAQQRGCSVGSTC